MLVIPDPRKFIRVIQTDQDSTMTTPTPDDTHYKDYKSDFASICMRDGDPSGRCPDPATGKFTITR
jgi:hypothetical protein